MKHLKRFESFLSNDLTQQLSRDAETNILNTDRLDKNKINPKNYTGTLFFNPEDNQYYLQIPNLENKPYMVKGVPPAPTLWVKLIPTEEFTQEDLDAYRTLSKIMTYGVADGSTKWKDYTYTVYGYETGSEVREAGVEAVIHIMSIEKNK